MDWSSSFSAHPPPRPPWGTDKVLSVGTLLHSVFQTLAERLSPAFFLFKDLFLIKNILLILPGKDKMTTTMFEPNLKQALLNNGQDNGHWPGLYPGFPEHGTTLHYPEAYEGKPHKATYFLHSSN